MELTVLKDHANSGSLVAAAFIMADFSKDFMGAGTASRDLGEAFRMMDLPVPGPGEFFQGDNADRVFLNTHNFVISVVYQKEAARWSLFSRKPKPSVFDACEIVRPDILQPIYSMALGDHGNCRLEIIPGVERVGVVNAQKAEEMARKLRNEGIEFYAPKPEYVGLLRTPGPEDNPLLIVNRRAIRPGKGFQPDGQASAGVQDRMFGPLQGAFEQAFRSASADEVKRVMDECGRIARLDDADPAKILRAHWIASSIGTPRAAQIRHTAMLYQQALAEHSLAA